jgi:hypothetical protein
MIDYPRLPPNLHIIQPVLPQTPDHRISALLGQITHPDQIHHLHFQIPHYFVEFFEPAAFFPYFIGTCCYFSSDSISNSCSLPLSSKLYAATCFFNFISCFFHCFCSFVGRLAARWAYRVSFSRIARKTLIKMWEFFGDHILSDYSPFSNNFLLNFGAGCFSA